MSVFMGDFLGFTLGDEHSYGLNITRVSTNDRYTDGLIPTFQDSTVQVPGGDGTYYWDTYYTQKTFEIEFAFDNLHDDDLRRLRKMFAYKGLKPLIFVYFPYKKYMVKCSSTPALTYLPFSDGEFRVYKGEGTVQLVAYYPYALATEPAIITYSKSGAQINNDGDLPCDSKIYFNRLDIGEQKIILKLKQDDNIISTLSFQSNNDGAGFMLVDSKTNLIKEVYGTFKTGVKETEQIYNENIISGDFFKIPLGRYKLESNVPFEYAEFTPLYY